MSNKIKSSVRKSINYPTEPKVKFVKKANMYCVTTFEQTNQGMKQIQKWSLEEPNV